VLAAAAAADEVITVLRGVGLAPAAESADGALLLARAPTRRAATPSRGSTGSGPAGGYPGGSVGAGAGRAPGVASRAELLRAARTLRAVDAAMHAPALSASPRRPPPARSTPIDPVSAVTALREAVDTRAQVWIGYLDHAGRPVRRLVEALSVQAGRVRAVELQTGELHSIAVHRVTSVAAADRAGA
jgi:hypothetical protein